MDEAIKNISAFALVIDDQEIHAYAAEMMLRKYALVARTVAFASANEALSFLTSIDDPAKFPDYIFADIHMPDVTGFDLYEKYLAIPEQLREKCSFIFLSSSRLPQDMERLKIFSGESRFVEKPLNKDKISALIK
jgi:CheY-like chemotaxis protein